MLVSAGDCEACSPAAASRIEAFEPQREPVMSWSSDLKRCCSRRGLPGHPL